MSKVYTALEANKAGVSAADRAGISAREYSGRFMFGKSCVAVSGDRMTCTDWVRHLPAPLRKSVKWDSMGLREVVYLGSYGMPSEDFYASFPDLD